MGSSTSSLELIAHFDAPVGCDQLPERITSTRNVLWVLQWAAALGVLFFAACVLLQLTYCVAAERTLSYAAQAGAIEATLPRATRESVVKTIERRLLGRSISTGSLQIAIQRNDAPVQRSFRLANDDCVSVSLSLPADAALPTWLGVANFWTGDAVIEARAERRMPSRELRTVGN